MTVYVDEVTEYPLDFVAAPARKYGAKWSHLWADDVEELHAFAKRIHLKRSWFQNRPRFPHYDVVPTMREVALSHGAQSKRLGEWLMEQRTKAKSSRILDSRRIRRGRVGAMTETTLFHGMDHQQIFRRIKAMDFVTPRLEEMRSRQALGDKAAKDAMNIYWFLWSSWDFNEVIRLEHAIERYKNEDD